VKLYQGDALEFLAAHLSVSSNGSTWVKLPGVVAVTGQEAAFSILERIDVGETSTATLIPAWLTRLSVSSNGSTWVKLRKPLGLRFRQPLFQYPRTDRRG